MRKFSDVRKQLDEQKLKSAVFAFGRFNPPTVGHAKLFDKVAQVGRTADYHVVYGSHSNDAKKNPLDPNFKKKVLRKAFPNNNVEVSSKAMPTALHIASLLYDKGYRKLTMVAGSDRYKEFKKMLDKYNGKKDRHGFYEFETIEVVSSGERDADSDDVTGASGTKMRMYAAKDDYESFRKYSPENLSDKDVKQIFDKVRAIVPRLTETFLPTLEIREQYLLGEVFNVGDVVADIYEGLEMTIVERCPNFVRCEMEDGTVVSKWLTDLEERAVAQDPDIDDKKGTQPKKYYAGLGKSTKDKRDAQFKKQAKMDDDDPNAYKPAPGDASAKTKPSKYTKKFKDMYGEELLDESNPKKALQKKADKTGISYAILKKVFDRGVAAWRTGHRPGTTPAQWGFARVNSFATGGKTRTTADADLWAKHSGKKESIEEEAPRWLRVPVSKVIGSKKYKAALAILKSIMDRKEKEAGGKKKMKHGSSYYAATVAKQFSGVDARELASMYDALQEEGGAGEWGTDKLTKKYKKDTPFQEQKINAEYEEEGYESREYAEEELEDDEEGAKEVAKSLELDTDAADEESDFDSFFDALDWEDIHLAYDDDELDAEEDDEHDLEDDEGIVNDDGEVQEVLSPAQRHKRRVLMRRIGKRLARIRKIRLKKRSSNEVLEKRARKVAIKLIKRKLIKDRPFSELSMADKARLEKYVQKKKSLVARLAKRMIPKMRKIENARIKGKRAESFTNFINSPIVEEAEYQGRKVKLNDPFRLPTGSEKKFGVYVKNDKGNVVKVTFGDPNMDIQRDNPERLKAFRARHGCDKDPGPKWKAKYWSCKMWEKGKKVSDLD
jgi:hypothetical protein